MKLAAEKEPVNCTTSELSTYLRALAAGFLPTFYSDTSPFALSSSICIASKSWRNGKRTGTFPGFPSLPMSASSTDGPGADSLMSSLADSPARTSVSQAKAQESTVSVPAYGAKWRGSLARFDPDSRSWKTAQHSLIEDSDECSVTWPRSGMTVDGQCYLLPTLGRRTGANESGLWQTPVADDSVNRAAGKFNSRGEPKLSAQVLWPTPHGFSPDGRSNGPSGNELERAVNQSLAWPTPTSSLGTKGGRVTPRKSREGGTLIEAASQRTEWTTPTVNGNYNKVGLSAKSGDGLATAVRETMATPTARDWRSGKASEATHAKNSRPLSEQVGGALSPDWVELLMGWPKGWTFLEPLESSEMRGWGEGWEDDTARVLAGVTNRVQRLKAIGNGQVPQCAAEAWRLLTCA